jgi:hypothetical protein
MAGIPIALTGDLLGADGAAHVKLRDHNGDPLDAMDGESIPASGFIHGIHQMGVSGDVSRAMTVSKFGRLDTPNRRVLLSEPIEGATLNGQRWTSTLTTMTATQTAAGGITLNASAITTITTGAALTSRASFARPPTGVLGYRVRARSTAVAGQEGMLGFVWQASLSATATLAAGDAACYFKFATDGSIRAAVWLNGSEVYLGTTNVAVAATYLTTNFHDYHIQIEEDRVNFLVTRTSAAGQVYVLLDEVFKLSDPSSKVAIVTHWQVRQSIRNNTVPASAGQIIFTEVQVSGLEIDHNLLWDQQLAENNLSTSISPTTYTQLAQFANSAAPASATLSNTAAGYTTLGGLWQFVALAGAVTDYCLFGFLVPSPYRLKIRGIRIDAWNTGAANAATPATTLVWGVGLNGTSANLGTGGHIRRVIGAQSIPINAAIGEAADKAIDEPYDVPLICEPGTTLAIILRVVSGAATASQIIQGSVDVRGVFE